MKGAIDYGEQIAELRDRIKAEQEKLREEVKRRKGRIAALEDRLDNLCDLQLGRAGAQAEVPGTEAAGVLAEARGSDKS